MSDLTFSYQLPIQIVSANQLRADDFIMDRKAHVVSVAPAPAGLNQTVVTKQNGNRIWYMNHHHVQIVKRDTLEYWAMWAQVQN